MEKKLAKIESIYFGLGGYNHAMIGLHVTLSGQSWGVQTDHSAWDCNIVKHSKYCKWTEEDRSRYYDEMVRYISDLLAKAKVSKVEDLKGKPVEVYFDESGSLSSWRILTEVL